MLEVAQELRRFPVAELLVHEQLLHLIFAGHGKALDQLVLQALVVGWPGEDVLYLRRVLPIQRGQDMVEFSRVVSNPHNCKLTFYLRKPNCWLFGPKRWDPYLYGCWE